MKYIFCLCICCLPFHTQKTKAEPDQRSLETHLHDETAKFRTKLAGKQHLICISFIFRSFFHPNSTKTFSSLFCICIVPTLLFTLPEAIFFVYDLFLFFVDDTFSFFCTVNQRTRSVTTKITRQTPENGQRFELGAV